MTKLLPFETWASVPNYPQYEVSSRAKIRRISSGRILKTTHGTTAGYLFVSIFNNGKRSKNITVHRLVAKMFVPNLLNKNRVNHKDGNILNNEAWNLEWSTQTENIFHSRHTTRNGAVISLQKIKFLYEKNTSATLSEFVELLEVNCR